MNFPSTLNPLRHTSFSWLFPATWAVIKQAAPGVPITVEVFLHRRFGARSGKLPVQGFIVLIVAFLAISAGAPPSAVPLFPFFVMAYIIAAVLQWFGGRFDPLPQEVYSYSSGIPWPLWRELPLDTTTVQRCVEPALCFLVACFVSSVDVGLSQWLTISAIALFIKGQMFRIRLRTQQLDTVDNRIVTEQGAPNGRTEAQNEQFVEARPAPGAAFGHPGRNRRHATAAPLGRNQH